MLCLSSCGEKTEYAPGFSEEGFERISIGDNIADIERNIGRPFGSTAHTVEGNRMTMVEWLIWEDLPKWSDNPEILIQLYYSRQVKSTVAYKYCSIRLQNGKVVDKIYHLITE